MKITRDQKQAEANAQRSRGGERPHLVDRMDTTFGTRHFKTEPAATPEEIINFHWERR